MKRSFVFVLSILTAILLVLTGCGPAGVPTLMPPVPTATLTEVPTATVIPSPEATATLTLSPQDAAIEAAWVDQKPLIDAAVNRVFKDVTSPWLWPVLSITTLMPDSPVSHCQAMKLWGNFIKVPATLTECSANHSSITDYFGITTVPLETRKDDKLVLKVFFYQPLPYCDNQKCILLPAPGSALYGMSIGDYYQVVSACQKPSGTPTRSSMYQLLPYLNDPVNLTIEWSGNYIEIVANRGAWFSFGWESGAGWDEAFQICPSP